MQHSKDIKHKKFEMSLYDIPCQYSTNVILIPILFLKCQDKAFTYSIYSLLIKSNKKNLLKAVPPFYLMSGLTKIYG